MTSLGRWFSAALSGVLIGAAFLPSAHWGLVLLAPLFLLAAVQGCSPGRACLLGWLSGGLVNVVGFHWLPLAVSRLQASSLGFGWAVMPLFVLWQGLPVALFAAGLALLQRRRAVSPVGIAGLWVLVEWGFPQVLPWTLANALAPSSVLRQAADLGGVPGLSFLIVCINACLLHVPAHKEVNAMAQRREGAERETKEEEMKIQQEATEEAENLSSVSSRPSSVPSVASCSIPFPGSGLRQGWVVLGWTSSNLVVFSTWMQPCLRWGLRRRVPWLVAGFAISGLWVGYGLWAWQAYADDTSSSSSPALRVAIVQANLGADSGYVWRDDLDWWSAYADMARAGAGTQPEFVIWPETVVRSFVRDDEVYRQRLQELAQSLNASLLVGSWERAPADSGVFNAAALFFPDALPAAAGAQAGAIQTYRKQHLLAFGEHVPWIAQWLMPFWYTSFEFVAAENVQPPLRLTTPVSTALAACICIEVLMPGMLNSAVMEGAQMLVSLTDDGWFADTAAPEQHLRVASLRAAETRRWLARASNSGISAVIDARGQVVRSQPFATAGTLHVAIPLRDDLTYYVRAGNWVVWLAALCLVTRSFASGLG